MKLKILIISYINTFFLIYCLEVQLNIHQNNTIINYTIINNTYKNELFNAEKIFYSKCRCKYNTDIFYISPDKNIINFTINTSEIKPQNENKLPIVEPNLYINSKNLDIEYTLNNTNENIYNLQINTMCKNPNYKNINNKKIIGENNIKNNGIYKIESYMIENNPDYNDNDYFSILIIIKLHIIFLSLKYVFMMKLGKVYYLVVV